MNIKEIKSTAYHIIELFVALCVTYFIIVSRTGDGIMDRVCYIEHWRGFLVILAIGGFISVPVLLIYLISLFRAIPFRSVWQKVILSIHVLNIALLPVLYLTLPKPQTCNAAIMEQHYLTHQQEMNDLIAYTKSCLDESTAIHYLTRDDKFWELKAYCYSDDLGSRVLQDIEGNKADSLLRCLGITKAQFDTINSKMKRAGIQGIDINRNACNLFFNTRHSYLTFRWRGYSQFLYCIIHQPEDDEGRTYGYECVAYNDSVQFLIPHDRSY